MKTTILLIVAVFSVIFSGCADLQTTGSGSGGEWTSIFNGKDLTGWVQRGGKANYQADKGTILGATVLKTPNSFLCTERTYANFILEMDFKVDSKLNSGVQIRSLSYPEYKNGRVHGYQVEIDPSDRAWSGGIYDEGRRGWLNNLKNNPAARKAFKKGQWNHFRIEAIGSHLKTWINGTPAADLEDSMTPAGFIGLQVHSTKIKDPLRVRWKNIRIKELD